jgi:hypothetical protein
MNAAVVGLAALGTALATGLGALPFVGRGRAVELGVGRALAGVLGGIACVVAARHWLGHRGPTDFGVQHGADAQRGVLLALENESRRAVAVAVTAAFLPMLGLQLLLLP